MKKMPERNFINGLIIQITDEELPSTVAILVATGTGICIAGLPSLLPRLLSSLLLLSFLQVVHVQRL